MAQQLTGTISGTVFDTAGAAVPNASVTLKNQASGDTRTTVTDGSGHFVITAVQPATYSVSITASGFRSWQENDIVMNQGDARQIPNIKLQVGGNTTSVEVIGGGAAVVPTDTPEISTSLNEKMINDFPLQGRDAGELLKIMPGMALNNPGGTGSSFNDKKGRFQQRPGRRLFVQRHPAERHHGLHAGWRQPGRSGKLRDPDRQHQSGHGRPDQNADVELQRRVCQGPLDFSGIQQERRPRLPR